MKRVVISDPHFDFNPDAARRLYKSIPDDVDCIIVPGDVSNNDWKAEEFFECFDRFSCEKLVCRGNHDEGFSRDTALGGSYGNPFPPKSHTTFEAIARKHGFKCPDQDKQWQVIDGVLLFNIFYKPGLTDADIAYTNDQHSYNVYEHIKGVEVPDDPEPVRFSISHLLPNVNIPTQYTQRHPMFYNTDIDTVLRSYKSPIHYLGHSHEDADIVIDGVRYINCAVGYNAPTDIRKFIVTG